MAGHWPSRTGDEKWCFRRKVLRPCRLGGSKAGRAELGPSVSGPATSASATKNATEAPSIVNSRAMRAHFWPAFRTTLAPHFGPAMQDPQLDLRPEQTPDATKVCEPVWRRSFAPPSLHIPELLRIICAPRTLRSRRSEAHRLMRAERGSALDASGRASSLCEPRGETRREGAPSNKPDRRRRSQSRTEMPASFDAAEPTEKVIAAASTDAR